MTSTIIVRALALAAAIAGCSAASDPADDSTAGGGYPGEGEEAGDQRPTSRARVCASGPTLLGIDVSFYQGTIDWPRVRAAGVEFAFIRVSDGTRFPDDRFADNWRNARAAGVRRGAYQFFRPAQDARAQADLILDRMGPLEPGDLPPVVDVEATGDLAPAEIAARVQQWVDRVQAATGVTPIVYTGTYFWEDEVGGSARFVDHPLWVAQYTSRCPDLPAPWRDWAFWQYTDAGRIDGVDGPVDTNRFNGDRAALDALGVEGTLAPIEVYWARRSDGSYDLRALAAASVDRVEYRVDGYLVASATRASGANFPTSYRFSVEADQRSLEVSGFAGEQRVARGIGLLDVTAGTGVYVKQMGAALYEIGLERPADEVAAIEVRADGFLLVDGVTGTSRSPRRAVRAAFTRLGLRELAITTYGTDGNPRGTLHRSFVLR